MTSVLDLRSVVSLLPIRLIQGKKCYKKGKSGGLLNVWTG